MTHFTPSQIAQMKRAFIGQTITDFDHEPSILPTRHLRRRGHRFGNDPPVRGCRVGVKSRLGRLDCGPGATPA